MSKHLFLLLSIVSLFSTLTSAQIYTPVTWSDSYKHLSDNEYELIFTAQIEEGWNIYSQYLESDEGPVRTSFEYDKGTHFSKIGKTTEKGKKKEGFDPLFNMNVIKFSDKVVFTQKVKVNDPSKPITGYLEFMTCDATKCLPPEMVDFAITVAPSTPSKAKDIAPKEVPLPSSPKIVTDKAPEKPSPIVKEPVTKSVESVKVEKKKLQKIPSSEEAPVAKPGQSEGILNPIEWSLIIKQITDNTYDLIYTAVIDKGWFTYSQYLDSEDGPVATNFNYDQLEEVTLLGKNKEQSQYRIEGYDKYFDMDVVKYKNEVSFTQRLKTDDPHNPITGFLEYMVCDAGRCLPPTDLGFYVLPSTGEVWVGAEADAKIDALARNGNPLEPTAPIVSSPTSQAKIVDGKIDQKVSSIVETYENPIGDCGEEDNASGQNMFWTFVLGFAGGLFALLTPCVFPMIPLTVSFFTAGSKDRKTGIKNGLIYGASIIVIYVTIGLIFTALFGPEILNILSTHWIPNTLFFLIFIFFAISFFGYFEITLPSSWTNKTDSMADQGGLIGTFFMAFTLALVSFSCTGPIIGTALVQSATDPMGPFVVMLGFSSALALPFGLFAAFPAWLNSLPSSGGWMNSVKVVLGFLELAFAFKFLSVADMTEHWGFLRYELFMAIWILLAIGLTLYLFGIIKFPHDSPVTKLSPTRKFFAFGSLALTLYLATGFLVNDKTGNYNSLGLLSGIAPPANYNFFLNKELSNTELKKRFKSYTKCANDLDCFKDYYEGLAYSKETNKPILLDFTGYGCVNCRKTEEHIWSEERVWDRINNDYVLVSLYVDDRKKLDEVFVSKYTNKKLRNVGNKWTDFQIVNFQQNSQPLYILMSPDEEVMASPRGYKEGVDDYADFLDCGLGTFSDLNKRTGMR